MNEPLHRIATKYRELLEDDDISPEDFSLRMDSVQDQLEHKIENCALHLSNLDAQETMLDTEIKRLKARVDTIHFRKERMRQYMLTYLNVAGVPKVKTALVSVTVVQGREHVVIESAAHVPDEFCKIERIPQKREILAHLQSGNPITGAHVERSSPYLLIR